MFWKIQVKFDPLKLEVIPCISPKLLLLLKRQLEVLSSICS